jgi:UDP-N-acetylmuramyl tripeptide synthase
VIANRIDPQIIAHLAMGNYPDGIMIITGTNGKTTTANLLANILRQAGKRFSCNEAGANLLTGITGAMAQSTRWTGRSAAQMALWEVDEATVPRLCELVKPALAVVTNFFRDQLDRYGELDTTVRLVREALPEDTRCILNADDPLVAQFGWQRAATVYFGVERLPESREISDEVRESRFCPLCGATLDYAWFQYGQLGNFTCAGCGFHRPQPHWQAQEVQRRQERMVFQVNGLELSLALQGTYNLYNGLAAYSAAKTLHIPDEAIRTGLSEFVPRAGRMESFAFPEGLLTLALVKNPAGCNQVIRTIVQAAQRREICLLIAINDQAADGRDISWLWDVDFEWLQEIAGQIRTIVCAGLRAEDMALRLKYAGIGMDKIRIEPALEIAVRTLRQSWGNGAHGYALPTYTALHPLRAILAAQSLSLAKNSAALRAQPAGREENI